MKIINKKVNYIKNFTISVFLSVMIFFAISCNDTETEETLKIVDLYGQLRVEGSNIIGQNGDSVVFRGMSFFWSQWIDKYYNYDCIKWLRDDWKCTVVRAAMGIEPDGYLANPAKEKEKVKTVINACIDLGIYVIVDWHDHNAQEHETEAIAFFKEIASEYGNHPNIIYEIYNEPTQVSWSEVVKPYSEAVIEEIRSIDEDNLIIVGTPTWSQDVDIAATDPIVLKNILYALHYYASSHKQSLRDKATAALGMGAALFVSEYGICEYTGDGIIDLDEANIWYMFMDDYNLSWCNWSIADKDESASALKPGANPRGNWSEEDLSESGKIVREKIRSSNGFIFDRLK